MGFPLEAQAAPLLAAPLVARPSQPTGKVRQSRSSYIDVIARSMQVRDATHTNPNPNPNPNPVPHVSCGYVRVDGGQDQAAAAVGNTLPDDEEQELTLPSTRSRGSRSVELGRGRGRGPALWRGLARLLHAADDDGQGSEFDLGEHTAGDLGSMHAEVGDSDRSVAADVGGSAPTNAAPVAPAAASLDPAPQEGAASAATGVKPERRRRHYKATLALLWRRAESSGTPASPVLSGGATKATRGTDHSDRAAAAAAASAAMPVAVNGQGQGEVAMARSAEAAIPTMIAATPAARTDTRGVRAGAATATGADTLPTRPSLASGPKAAVAEGGGRPPWTRYDDFTRVLETLTEPPRTPVPLSSQFIAAWRRCWELLAAEVHARATLARLDPGAMAPPLLCPTGRPDADAALREVMERLENVLTDYAERQHRASRRTMAQFYETRKLFNVLASNMVRTQSAQRDTSAHESE
jgi:hypothetical protein